MNECEKRTGRKMMMKHKFIVICMVLLMMAGSAYAAVFPANAPLGSIDGIVKKPVRMAVDNVGQIYVTDDFSRSLYIFSNNGILLKTIGNLIRPLGVAVGSGKIFVGDQGNGSVCVYDSEGIMLYKLGAGDGEFKQPTDLAACSQGIIYVADSGKNLISAYATAGDFLFSFGSTEVNFPSGIALDEPAGEVYVSDQNNKRILIYDLNGVYKRQISGGGGGMFSSGGTIQAIQGIALDDTRIYISDSYNSTLAVYDKNGTFLNYLGKYGQEPGELRIPLDAAFDKDGKLFVASSNNNRVEIYGIDSYKDLKTKPSAVAISVFENAEPLIQAIDLSSTNETAWTASTTAPWVSVDQPRGVTPAKAQITVNPLGLAAGAYQGRVNFATGSGTAAATLVTLEVLPSPKELSVSPKTISMTYQKGSDAVVSGDIVLTSKGGSLSWNASSSVSWISLGKASGITPDSVRLTATDAVKALQPGDYEGKITINAGTAAGSPASVTVNLKVVTAGTIKVLTNLDQASFTIAGTGQYSGSGKTWVNSQVAPGSYAITFGYVQGFIKPFSQTFTVETGKETVINGIYRGKKVATHIVAASKEGNRVSVIDFSGEVLATFEPFRAEHGVGVASGDLEGTGIDSIVVTDHRRTLGVYTADGHKLAVKRLSSLYRETEVTVADIDGDGKDEIIVSSEVLQPGISKESGILNAFNYGDVWKKARTLDVFTYHDGRLEKEGILYKDSGEGILRVAFGDIDGDGNPELLVADQGKLKAYRMNEGNRIDVRSPLWQVETGYEEDEHIAAGDIDGDGAAEIAVSGEPDKKITSHGATGMMVMKGTGEKYALALDAFEDLGYYGSCSVALGDIDSDGINEIVVGSGERIGKGSLIRVFESDGTFTGHTITLIDREGVTLSLGKFR